MTGNGVTARQWWKKPRLRRDEDEHQERKVTWLELFYDLVFVVVIAELSHSLAEHVSVAGVMTFALLFIPVWWVWIGGTFYNDRFETDDLSHRLFTFLQMLPVGAMAVFAHDGLGATSVGFALSYAAARVLIIYLWLRGGLHDAEARPLTTRYSVGFGVSVLLFVISVFVPAPARFMLWGVGLIFDLLTPLTTLHVQRQLPRLTTSHLPERFGLFVIIVLGESVVGVVQGVAERDSLTWLSALTAALGMALAFGMWWLYFDFIARRRAKPGVWWFALWTYLHVPFVMATTALGAGVLNVVSNEDATLPGESRWLLVGAVAMALLTLGVLELVLYRAADEPTRAFISVPLKLISGFIAAGFGFWGAGFGSTTLLSLLLLLVIVNMIYGAAAWFRQTALAPVGNAQD